MERAIVVHDPAGIVLDGQIISGHNAIEAARRAGLVVLPHEGGRDGEAVGGYFRRAWGDGLALRRGVGTRLCPMLLHVEPGRDWIYWAAIVVPNGPEPKGVVRLTSDIPRQFSQAAAIALTEDAVPRIEALERGKPYWAIGGRARISISAPGYVALSLYGAGSDIAVTLGAVVQARENIAFP